jgi:hypothetical protein
VAVLSSLPTRDAGQKKLRFKPKPVVDGILEALLTSKVAFHRLDQHMP